jgi:hypothetical protein
MAKSSKQRKGGARKKTAAEAGDTAEIAYCGLYCAECPSHVGKIADLARDLREELRDVRFDKAAAFFSTISFFKAYEKYPECYEVLGQMVKMRCGKVCRTGGGNPACKIRICVRKKGYEGCWECAEFELCEKMDFLKGVHGHAHTENLKAIKEGGVAKFLNGKKHWYCE